MVWYDLLATWWKDLYEYDESKQTFISIAVVVFLFGTWHGWSWYTTQREERAQFAFAEANDEYDSALGTALKKDAVKDVVDQQWQDAFLAFNSVYKNHKSSHLSPYALAMQADVLAHTGKIDEAMIFLNKALDAMGEKSPAYYLYKTKRALLYFDSSSEDGPQKGLAELEQLAKDEKNHNRYVALFYQGSYYWSQQQYEKARTIWQEFIDLSQKIKNKRSISPYIAVVHEKMEQIA